MKTLKHSIQYETQSIKENEFPEDLTVTNKARFEEASRKLPLLGIELEYDIGRLADYTCLENYALEASNKSGNLPLVFKPDLSLHKKYNVELNTAPAPLYQTLRFVKHLYRDAAFFHKNPGFIHSGTGLHIHFALGTGGESIPWLKSPIAIGVFVMLANSVKVNRSDIVRSFLHRDFQTYTRSCSEPFSFSKLEGNDLPSSFYEGLARLRIETIEWRSPRAPRSYKEFVESVTVVLLMINFSNRFARYYVDTYSDNNIHTPEVKDVLFNDFLQYFEKRHLVYRNFFCNMSFED